MVHEDGPQRHRAMPTVPAVPATLPGYAIHRESAYDAVKLQSSAAAAASSSSSSSRAAVVKRVTFVRHAEGAFVCLFVRSFVRSFVVRFGL